MEQQLSEDDVMRRLEQYRPASRSEEWGAADRDAALATAMHTDQATRVRFTPSSRRRRWAAIAGGVAATAAAVLVVELVPSTSHVLPGGTPQHSTVTSPTPHAVGPVQRLADAARHTTLGSPRAGQFWYQKVRVGTGSNVNWVAPNGDDWNESGGAGSCTYYKYVGAPNPNHANTAYLSSLPTDPSALYRYLHAHVTGSGSTTEAIFVAIGDMLHNDEGLVPRDVRAAFVQVLARVPSVTVRSGVAYGRGGSATTFTFRGHPALWFDETTAQVVYKNGAPTYRIVDALPARVEDRSTCPRGGN